MAVNEIQSTPNPNAKKFVLDKPVFQQAQSFFDPETASSHPVASQLFSIPGVTSVLLLGDFVTVNKDQQTKWPKILKGVEAVLNSV